MKKKIFEKLKKFITFNQVRTIRNFSIDPFRFSLLYRTTYNLLSPTKLILKGKRSDLFSRYKTLSGWNQAAARHVSRNSKIPVIKSHITGGTGWNVRENPLASYSNANLNRFSMYQFFHSNSSKILLNRSRDRRKRRVEIKIERWEKSDSIVTYYYYR